MDKDNSLISIIMPAYNAEKYIARAIDSVINQSYGNWELIIVDDGSTDATPGIADDYATRDERINAIHQANYGVSVARNAGLNIAHGEFIAFLDADDVLTPDSLKIRINLIADSDMALAGYVIENESGEEISKMPECKSDSWNQYEAIKNTVVDGKLGYQGYPWNKLYKKSLIEEHSIRFEPEIAFNEDRLFAVSYLMHCNKVNLCSDSVYCYILNGNGAMADFANMTDDKADKYMTEYRAYYLICMQIKGKYNDCYHACAYEAYMKVWKLSKYIAPEKVKIKKKLKKYITLFGLMTLGTDFKILPPFKQAKVLGHAVLQR